MAISNKREKLSFALSLALHSLVFISLTFKGTGQGDGDGKKKGGGESRYNGVNVGDVIPKERPVEVEIVETPPEKAEIVTKEKPKKKVVNAEKECPGKWYGGIGIRNSFDPIFRCERIAEVFPGYAADLAGLQVGDLILWTSDKEIVGPPDSVFQMKVLRGGDTLLFTLKRVKVCY